MAVHDADQPRWADENTWVCYQCNEYKDRVVVINGDYFCAECLMTAVIKGKLTLADRRCAHCNDIIEDDSSVYCESCHTESETISCNNCGYSTGSPVFCSDCYENAGSSQYCGSCGDETQLYCYSCAQSEWDLGTCDRSCGECGNGPHEFTYCYDCMREANGCSECGDFNVTTRLCPDHERVTVAAAQAVDTVDGNEFTFDDGVVVRFNDGG